MAPDFYFFTDTNLISTSTLRSADPGSGAFGPAGTVAGKDQYRVSSIHKATANPTAYAVCEGIVFAQRIPTSSTTTPKLLNLILKPLVQPGPNFAPVKYFIYKGILEDSLISGSQMAPRTTNDLTSAVWEAQDTKNVLANPPTPGAAPSAKSLNVGLIAGVSGFADTDPIDNLFHPIAAPLSGFLAVKGGWSIGQFDMKAFGMDVLMEGLGFDHSLSLARALENLISVESVDIDIDPPKKTFEHWHAKEQVLRFMDACAFYGSFFRSGILAKTSSGSFVKESGNALYHNVLSAFANKNVAYLDIRNEHNFSLNYFTNYGDDIEFSGDPGNVAPARLNYYASNWPILTLDAAHVSFPTSNTTKARNAFQIQLPVGDNPQPLLYVSQGYRDIHRRRRGFPEELKGVERFFDAFEPSVGVFTATRSGSGHRSMTFVVPNVTGQAVTTPVSCYIRLKYLKRQQGVTAFPTVIQSDSYLDNLFYPFDLRILFKAQFKIKSFVYDEEIYVNALGTPGLGFDGIAKVGIARDDKHTSFFLTPTLMRTMKGKATALVTLAGEFSRVAAHYPNFVALKYPLERVVASKPMLSAPGHTPVATPVAKFVSDGDAVAQAKFNVPDFDKFFMIVIANATYDDWQSRVMAAGARIDPRFRVYLGVKTLPAVTDSLGVQYNSFELILRGFGYDASAGNYTVQEMNTDPVSSADNVKVYTHAGA